MTTKPSSDSLLAASSLLPLQASSSADGSASREQDVKTLPTLDEDETDLMSDSKLSEMMREQDADLLESMHYASSQVSQYSPGGTPLLRPKDRSLPMEDVPLMLMPLSSTSQLLMARDSSLAASSGSMSPGKQTCRSLREALSDLAGDGVDDTRESGPYHSRSTSLAALSQQTSYSFLPPASEEGEESKAVEENKSVSWMDEPAEKGTQQSTSSDTRGFRRLLSGEVRSVDHDVSTSAATSTSAQQPASGDVAAANDQEQETTASPVSVAQEATKSIIESSTEQDEELAEQRRVREAIQFAEAVGEPGSLHREELRIIEDHSEDGDSIDSDDDEACEPTEIRVSDMASIEEVLSQNAQSTRPSKSTEKLEPSVPALPNHVDIQPNSANRKSKRPLWPFGPAGTDFSFLDSNLSQENEPSFAYKGICANPPEITKRGIQRGNYAQLHRKAWLEVSDKYHRYGKNLRLYYRHWESLDFPTNQFFDWLDSKGEAAGQPLPNLEDCPRSVLDSDTVLYITNPDVTDGYALDIVCNDEGRGRVIDVDGKPVVSGTDGWIFVLRDNVLYGAQKITSISGHITKRFHHSSFFGGKAVASAGILITDEDGYLTRLYPHSGHYRPGQAHMQRMLFFLHRKGVNLRTFEVDTQQFRHVSREKEGKKEKSDRTDMDKKAKKVDSLHLEKGISVACFLAHKAGFIGNGIFDRIHKIRSADVTSVSEALKLVDNGGYWRRTRQRFLSEESTQEE